jgi:hypothetical protein
MKNVTITLHEDVARWARICAAEQETSVSRLIGELLKQKMLDEKAYGTAMQQYLCRPAKALKQPGAGYPRRDELHDR